MSDLCIKCEGPVCGRRHAISCDSYDPLDIIYPTKKETHHLELINSHEGNKWCALYISAKVEFY